MPTFTSRPAPVVRAGDPGTAARVMVAVLALLWGIEVVDQATGNALDQGGIVPRSEGGLLSIPLAPLLHYGWSHLLGNSVPLFVLGFLVLLGGLRRWLLTTLVVVLVSGMTVWLLAPPHSVTLGASGVVFGWLTYLLTRGLVTRDWRHLLLAVVVFLLYGGMLLGVLPLAVGVSWQAHLGGAAGGVLAASLLHPRRPSRPTGSARNGRSG